MRDPRYCLQCDDGTELVHATKDITVTNSKGMSMHVSAVDGWHCPVCGEIEFADNGSAARVWAAHEALASQAKKQEGQWVREIRKKLKLSQKEAAEVFGGGVNAFSEYELGKTQPHKSTIALLKVLERHPELLREVR